MIIFVCNGMDFNPKQCFGWTLCTRFSVMQCYLNTHIFFFWPTQTPRSCVRFIIQNNAWGEHSAPCLASCSVTWTPISFFFANSDTSLLCQIHSGMYLACPQKTCWFGYPHPNSSIHVHVTPAVQRHVPLLTAWVMKIMRWQPVLAR